MNTHMTGLERFICCSMGIRFGDKNVVLPQLVDALGPFMLTSRSPRWSPDQQYRLHSRICLCSFVPEVLMLTTAKRCPSHYSMPVMSQGAAIFAHVRRKMTALREHSRSR
jgi:hypothetical protein